MKDLTKGNIYKTFFLFGLPLVLSGVLTQAYTIVNSVIAGRFLGETGLASTGATAPLDTFIDSIFWGLGAGFSVYIAKLFTANENGKLKASFRTCYALFAIFLIPRLGIWGYIISIYATEILNTTLSLIKMISVSKIKFGVFHGIVTPILCIIGATNLSKLIFYFIPIEPRGVVGLITQLILTVFLYIALLLITRAIGKDEWEFIYASVLSKKAYDRKFSLQSD
jgi:hypothetical protein